MPACRCSPTPATPPAPSRVHRGGITANATSYGGRNEYLPEDRPANAVDGDPTTRGEPSRDDPIVGRAPRAAHSSEPVTTSTLTFLAPPPPINRWVTQVALRFDGEPARRSCRSTSGPAPAPARWSTSAPARSRTLDIEVLGGHRRAARPLRRPHQHRLRRGDGRRPPAGRGRAAARRPAPSGRSGQHRPPAGHRAHPAAIRPHRRRAPRRGAEPRPSPRPARRPRVLPHRHSPAVPPGGRCVARLRAGRCSWRTRARDIVVPPRRHRGASVGRR